MRMLSSDWMRTMRRRLPSGLSAAVFGFPPQRSTFFAQRVDGLDAPLSKQPLAGRSCMPLRPNYPKSGAGSWPPKSTQGLIEAALRDRTLQGLLITKPFRLQPVKPHRAACAYQDQTPISKSNPQGLVFRVERFINQPRLVLRNCVPRLPVTRVALSRLNHVIPVDDPF